ncbi:MAG: hypothetical protein R3A10_23950 [Caldilineaceae bacterium]
MCVFNQTCSTGLAIEPQRRRYSCDHFVEPNYLIGNIHDEHMIELGSAPSSQFGQDKYDDLPRYCHRGRRALRLPRGVSQERFITTPDGEPGLDYLCAG